MTKLDKQIVIHRNNLVALRCDESASEPFESEAAEREVIGGKLAAELERIRDSAAIGAIGSTKQKAVGQTIERHQTAAHLRGSNGERFTFTCPGDQGFPAAWRVVGDGTYRDDSAICIAAIHDGIITSAAGGTVTIEIRPGEKNYSGSKRNGVESKSLWDGKGSFIFIR